MEPVFVKTVQVTVSNWCLDQNCNLCAKISTMNTLCMASKIVGQSSRDFNARCNYDIKSLHSNNEKISNGLETKTLNSTGTARFKLILNLVLISMLYTLSLLVTDKGWDKVIDHQFA